MNNNLIKVYRPDGQFIGIQSKESQIMQWDLNDEEYGLVSFKWNKFGLESETKKNDIQIKIAQANPHKDIKSIKEIANDYQVSVNINEFDKIIEFDGQNIVKIGFVSDKKIGQNNGVSVSIKWVSNELLKLSNYGIFKENSVLQVLSNTQLSKIEKEHKDVLPLIYKQLPDSVPDLNWFKHNIISENIEKQQDVEVLLEQNKEDKGGVLNLFYGTNRNRSENKKYIEYGKEVSDLKVGFCKVQIPVGHIEGELERPGRIIIWSLPENEKKHIVIKELRQVEITQFWNDLNDLIHDSNDEILLFIHGFNTTFKEAALRTAQLAWDLKLKCKSGFYSWPSTGTMPDYLADEAKVRSSVPNFQEFLLGILNNSQINKIHIIAHSMGSLLLSLTLSNIQKNSTISPFLSKIHQVILAAPDIDQEEFKKSILPEFRLLGSRRTIYASDHDKALKASSIFRRNRLRLGQIGSDIFLDSTIDTIAVSNINDVDYHGYIFESKSLLNDIYFLVSQGLAPIDRRLSEIKIKQLSYWLFPKGF